MLRQQSGFTFIELVLAMMLMSIISVVIGRVLLHSYRANLTSQNITEVDWQCFIALQRMVNDIYRIRSAGDISNAQSTQLTFINMDGSTIQYQFGSSVITRNSQTLANGIQSFNFSYLDKNGAITAAPAAIRYIVLSMTALQDNTSSACTTMAVTRDTT